MTSARPRWTAVVIAILAICVLGASDAAALRFDPTRVVLTERQRTATLRLMNAESEPISYNVSWIRIRMTNDKGLEIIESDDDAKDLQPARDFILYAPRQSVVAPRSGQLVRLLARPPADLPDGEYRSHLAISEAPEVQGNTGDDAPDQGLGVQFTTISRTTIPVIYRHGDLHAEVEVKRLELVRNGAGGGPSLLVTLTRSGNRSAYGDVDVTWVRPSGEEVVVHQSRGHSIYTELAFRDFRHRLRLPDDTSLDGGTLRYRFRERDVDDPAHAEATIAVR